MHFYKQREISLNFKPRTIFWIHVHLTDWRKRYIFVMAKLQCLHFVVIFFSVSYSSSYKVFISLCIDLKPDIKLTL